MCEKQGPPVEAAGASTGSMRAERDADYNATATDSQVRFLKIIIERSKIPSSRIGLFEIWIGKPGIILSY